MTVTSTTEISTAWAYKDKVTSTQSNCYSKPFLDTQYLLKHTPEDREAERESTGYVLVGQKEKWKERKTKDLMKKYDRPREREREIWCEKTK